MALPRTLKEIQFIGGLDTKSDARAQPEQLLDIATNIEFDDVGGARCRFPFDNVRTALVGGGTLSNARRMFMNGNELCCFTDVALYSWNVQASGWVLKGTHLAVSCVEGETFATNGDQLDPDRAELNNTIVYTWSNASKVYVAALDKNNGAVLLAPTALAGTGTRPRLLALTTKIMLFWHTGTDAAVATFVCVAIDPAPANIAASVIATPTLLADVAAGGTFGGNGFNAFYDVCRNLVSLDQALFIVRLTTMTSYGVGSVTAALAIARASKVRTCEQAVAISSSPGGYMQIVRANAGALQGDLENPAAAFADVAINQAVGAYTGVLNQIAAAHRSVKNGGSYRCYVFWSYNEVGDAGTPWQSWSNWVDDGGALGAAAVFIRRNGVASRAWDYNGQVYVWLVFAGTSTFSGGNSAGYKAKLQNTYFLYRDDSHWVAEAAATRAAGFASSQSRLPGVALTAGATTFSWCGGARRVIAIGANQFGYAARDPYDVTFTFDSNLARRTVQLGRTTYITGALILQYDGVALNEVGFHVYPWYFGAVQIGGGNVANGSYGTKCTWKWTNASGERDRSSTATVGTFTIAAGPGTISYNVLVPLCNTRKTSIPPSVELWRTAVNPALTSPFFLVTNQDPSVVANPNRYLANDPTVDALPTVNDALADAAATLLENNPENGAVLQALAPRGATIIAANETRLFLAGIAGDPNTVWYSKQRAAGEVAAFNDQLTFSVPADAGPITALGFLDGVLVVWCTTATYAYAGVGFDNTGGGGNFQLARTLSKDLGCIGPEACVLFEDGYLAKTNKGWFLLDRSLNYTYIGGLIAGYDAESVRATSTLTARHQVRVLTSGRALVFDTNIKQWSETSINDGLDMLLWNGVPAYLTATGVRAELATWAGYAGTDYTLTLMDIETSWIKFGGLQSRAIVDFVQLLGQLDSTCVIRKRIAKDYEASSPGVWNYHTDFTWTPSPGTLGSALQVRQAPKKKRCESLKARFTITAPDGVSPLGGPCAHLTSIAMQYAIEPNAYSALSAAQRQ